MRGRYLARMCWLPAVGAALMAHAEPPSSLRVPPPEYSAATVVDSESQELEPLYNPLGAPPRSAYPAMVGPGASARDTLEASLSDALRDAETGATPLSGPMAQRARGLWGGPKPGFFQRITAYETWLAGGGAAAIQSHEMTAFVTGGVPFFRFDSPLLFTPGFTALFLEGPDQPDVPPRLYDATLEVRHLRQLTERLGMDLVVTTGVYSDFEQSSSDMVRVTGRAVAAWQWRPKTQLILGVAYLNRGNLKLLPAVGVILTPSDDWRIEAIAPRPRIARRLMATADSELWGYLAGEVGGGVWAVDRLDGSGDLLTLNDFRLRLGLERFVRDGLKGWFEVGYVFGRSLSYRSVDQTVDLADALLLRAGLAY